MSLVALCDTQAEIDDYWDKLGAGGQTMACGWLTDKYGVAWQVAPRIFPKLWSGDQVSTDRVMAAMMKMVKLDIAGLQKAFDGQ
jgi:predicted 3-demethylubiquinone-9 3-methyltransferase (glyoxalase superfamily)